MATPRLRSRSKLICSALPCSPIARFLWLHARSRWSYPHLVGGKPSSSRWSLWCNTSEEGGGGRPLQARSVGLDLPVPGACPSYDQLRHLLALPFSVFPIFYFFKKINLVRSLFLQAAWDPTSKHRGADAHPLPEKRRRTKLTREKISLLDRVLVLESMKETRKRDSRKP